LAPVTRTRITPRKRNAKRTRVNVYPTSDLFALFQAEAARRKLNTSVVIGERLMDSAIIQQGRMSAHERANGVPIPLATTGRGG
jgi:hypothetical protein